MTILWEKYLNFFKFVSVLCFETPFEIQEFMREIFDFWKLANFLRKSRCLKKMKYFRKDLWIVWENTFTLHIIALYLRINSLSVTYLLTLFFVVFFVSMILKTLLCNINDKCEKRHTNYEIRCENKDEYVIVSAKFITNASMEKCKNANSVIA